MSKAKKLNEGIVTSLADTDLLVAADNGGSLRPISVTNLMQLIRDNIKVGGRNYVALSKSTLVNASRDGYTIMQGVGDTRSLMFQIQLINGNSLVRVAYEKFITQAGKKTIKFSVSDAENVNIIFIKHQGQSHDFGIRIPFTEKGDFILTLNIGSVTQGEISFSNLMLERGNIPTDWSPAPEDLSGGGNAQIFNQLQFAIHKAERRAA